MPFFGLLLLGAGVPPLLNWTFDPAGVLRRDYYTSYYRTYPNLAGNVRFLKVAYVVDHPERFDSFVFGSSRVRYGIPVDALGANWFKLDFPGGVPDELLPTLEILKQKGVSVRAAWLALDDFALYDVRDTEGDFFLRHYPRSLPEWLSFYRFYLYRRPGDFEWKILQRVVRGGPLRVNSARIIGEREGIPVAYEDPSAHADRLSRQAPARRDMVDEAPRSEALLATIEALVEFCRREQIVLRVFITPRYAKTLYYRNYDHLDDFKRRLARITPFDDFTTLNDAVRDARNWHEPSHFGPVLGARIVEAIRSGHVDSSGLGRHITPDTVEAHLREHRASLRAALPEILEDDPGIEIHETLLDPTPVFRAELGGRSPLRRSSGLEAVAPLSALHFRSTAERSALVFAPIEVQAPDDETLYLRLGLHSQELGAVWLPRQVPSGASVEIRTPDGSDSGALGLARWRFLRIGSNFVFAAVDARTLRRGLVVELARGAEYRIESLEVRRLQTAR